MEISEGAFWDMNITKLRPYLIAENIKREDRNYFCWLQGVYNYRAVKAVVEGALPHKGRKVDEYPKEPRRITPLTEQEKTEKIAYERQRAINFFNALKKSFDENNPERKE